jgi:hypothetical protein
MENGGEQTEPVVGASDGEIVGGYEINRELQTGLEGCGVRELTDEELALLEAGGMAGKGIGVRELEETDE